jgi:small acid-soluble spore protein F (minor alpha/beta-type SASP)
MQGDVIMTVPFKKIVKAKIKSHKELTPEEIEREKIKYEIAGELGLFEKVIKCGWSGLTAEETGRIGGIMTQKNKEEGRRWNKKL